MQDRLMEQYMERNMIEYEYLESVPVAKLKTSKTNNRLGVQIDEVNVAGMMNTLESGGELPAPVAIKNGAGYNVLQGNHRTTAMARSGKDATDLYVIKNESEQAIALIQYEGNVLTGCDTIAQRVDMAVLLNLDYGFSAEDAAKRMGVSKTSVYKALSVRKNIAKLQESNHDMKRFPINDAQARALTVIEHRTPAILETARLASEFKLTGDETRDIAKQMNTAPDDAAIKEISASARRLYATRAKRPKRKSSRSTSDLKRSLAHVVNFVTDKTGLPALAKEASRKEKDEVLIRVDAAKEALKKITDALA